MKKVKKSCKSYIVLWAIWSFLGIFLYSGIELIVWIVGGLAMIVAVLFNEKK